MDYLKLRGTIMIWMEFLLKQVNIKTFQNKILNNEISKMKLRFFTCFPYQKNQLLRMKIVLK